MSVTVKAPVARTPLAHRDALSGATLSDEKLTLTEISGEARLILRGDFEILGEAVKAACSVELPVAGKSISSDGIRVFWQGPDTLLISCAMQKADNIKTLLSAALGDKHYQLVGVSNHFVEVELCGAHAHEVLMKLSTIDLHRAVFQPNDAVSTTLGSANVMLTMKEEGVFRIIMRASFADYVWCDIAHAGMQFGLPKQKHGYGEIIRQ